MTLDALSQPAVPDELVTLVGDLYEQYARMTCAYLYSLVAGLAYYELAYRGAAADFKRFAGGFKQVKIASVLGEFETAGLPNGEYTIRLQAADKLGELTTPCMIRVTVEN